MTKYARRLTKSVAQELRHETLRASITSTADAIVEFRNDSAGMIHIRGIDWEAQLTGENDERARMELSKAPAYQGITTGSPFFRYGFRIGIEGSTTGAATDDGTVTVHRSRRWGRGQLTLEPNESLFLNATVTGSGQVDGASVIEYEFS